jgi:hypothetical protein
MAITLEHTSHLLQPQILPFSKNSSTLTQNGNDTGTQFSPLATPETAMLKNSSNTKTAKIETLNNTTTCAQRKAITKCHPATQEEEVNKQFTDNRYKKGLN